VEGAGEVRDTFEGGPSYKSLGTSVLYIKAQESVPFTAKLTNLEIIKA
jgi:hypothetical protein